MALRIPQFENPFDPSNPFADAYAWTAGLGLDLFAGQGRVTANVNPNENAWQSPPIDQVSISLGDELSPAVYDQDGNVVTPAVKVKTLAELMADPEFAQAYQVLGGKLYQELAKHPKFSGATQV